MKRVRPKESASHSTTERIVAAARAEFAEHGQAGARVERIARRAGVNKAMLYYHFGSKQQLYLEVVLSYYKSAAEKFKERLTETDSLEAFLLKLANIYAELAESYPELRPILLRELANPQPEVIKQISELITGIGLPQRALNMVTQGIADGTLRTVDPKQVFAAFVCTNIGYFLMAPLTNYILAIDDPAEFMAARKAAVVDLFLNGVKMR